MSRIDNDSSWWKEGVLYQIYPRSFQDSNGDGIGDLPGITRRLPYIASLGVDGVWLSPFFKSPMKDFGYDVADHCDVDPIFGTLADFDALVARAHDLGLRVLIDLVLSHTSTDHTWFCQSRADRTNERADWYVWADARDDGTPPNNWLSLFGGSAWQWDTRRGQYYLHNFLTSQPDLNFHAPQVQQAVLDVAEFWLQRGVDGFRLDAVNVFFHDRQLRSNPPQIPGQFAACVARSNPYARQIHLFDKTQPENLDFLERFRSLMDRYPGTTTIGEISDDRQYETLSAYTSRSRLHMAYIFTLLERDCSAHYIHGQLQEYVEKTAGAWACWSLNNHDVDRVLSRWRALGEPQRLGPLLISLLCSLRGSPCLFQGEELGLTQAYVPFEALQDPYGKEMWPEVPGRDGCRTPMPWEHGSAHGAFTTGTPWLPVAPEHLPLAVSAQEADALSLLHVYRRLLQWRRTQPLLLAGDMTMLPAHPQVVAFMRHGPVAGIERQLVCAFNLSDAPASYVLPGDGGLADVQGHGFVCSREGSTLTLPPHQAFFGYRLPETEAPNMEFTCAA